MKQLIKDSEISATILKLVDYGVTLPTALNLVLGEGTYEGLVDDLYAALKGA